MRRKGRLNSHRYRDFPVRRKRIRETGSRSEIRTSWWLRRWDSCLSTIGEWSGWLGRISELGGFKVRGAIGTEGVECGEGISPGRGLCPLCRKFLYFFGFTWHVLVHSGTFSRRQETEFPSRLSSLTLRTFTVTAMSWLCYFCLNDVILLNDCLGIFERAEVARWQHCNADNFKAL